jgi:hypothetical protein
MHLGVTKGGQVTETGIKKAETSPGGDGLSSGKTEKAVIGGFI